MNKYESMTDEELRLYLSELYKEVENLITHRNKQKESIDYNYAVYTYGRELLIEECINMENIINTVRKAKVINKDLGFQFYLRPRTYVSDKGEQIILGTNIVLYAEKSRRVKSSFNGRVARIDIGNRNSSVDFRLPHSWRHVQLCKSLFLDIGDTVTIHFKDITQLDFNSTMINNMNKIIMITNTKDRDLRESINKLVDKSRKQRYKYSSQDIS